MSKNPNQHLIQVAQLAAKYADFNLNPADMSSVIKLTCDLLNMAQLAKIALRQENAIFRDSNGRPVVDLGSEGSGVDAFFTSATYGDDGSPVDENELDYLTEIYPEELEEQSGGRHAMRREDAYDASRGH